MGRSLISFTPVSTSDAKSKLQRPKSIKGIAFMALGMFLFCTVDTQAKFLTDTLHPIQIVWLRQLGLLFGVLVLLFVRGVSILQTDHLKLQITRGTIVIISPVCFVTALMFVPLADAVAVSFVAPFFVIILAAIFLKEQIGLHRWTAVIIGFIATLIIIRPGLGVVHPAVFLVFIAASLFSVRQILSRYMSRSDRTITTIAYTALIGSFWLTFAMPFVWTWPTSNLEIILIISISVLAAIAEISVIKALELTEAVILGPVHYTLIVWGVFYGFVVFGQTPDLWTWIGTTIIIMCGLYTLYREWVLSNKKNRQLKSL
jgi:drug/metabolite transporter (DMT)-like permease